MQIKFISNLVVVVSLITLSAVIAAEPVRVACVGDSITYGAGVDNRGVNNYPKVLGTLLGENYDVRNYGVSGATLLKKGDKPYWGLREFKAVAEFNPQIVVLKLGTNDSKPQNWKYKEEFADDLRAMLDAFASFPAKPKVWICLPVPVYQDKWGINEATIKGEVIPVIRSVAKEKGAATVDLYTALTGHPKDFPDGVHPNAAGAALIAQTVHGAITGK